MAISDGSTGAPGTTPILPNLLNGYAVRPSWQVAGVDYGVGVAPGVVLKTPTANNLPVGASLSNGAIYIDGKNVTLSGYNLTGLTVMVNADATGTVTVTNCAATSGVNIRSTVDATANLVVTNCSLNGGYAASDPNFQLIKVWCPLTVEYSLIEGSSGGIYEGGASLTVLYNVLQGFGQYNVNHANAIYVTGSDSSSVTTTIAYNTLYSEATRSSSGFQVTGLGAAIAFFGDGGNFYNSTVTNNTVVSAMPGAASYLIGYYVNAGASATGGTVSNNYLASYDGFNNADSGAFGAFYTGSAGAVQATYSGNIDMSNGATINSTNGESGGGSGSGSGGSTTPSAPKIASWSPDTGVAGDGITGANKLTMIGTAVAGGLVKVYDGSTLLGSATASSTGAWTLATATLGDGVHSFTATDTVSGVTSAASSAIAVTVDTTAPAAPVETGDTIVNGNQVTVTGTAQASTTIKVYDGATLVGTGATTSGGAWSVTTSALPAGANVLTATATDAAGNVSALSAALDPVIPATPASAPTIASWSPDTGVAGDGITGANKLTMIGTAVAGGLVKVYDGSTLLGSATASSTGAWTFATATLGDGVHSFTATDTVSGVTGAASSAIAVTVDTAAPAAPVETGDTIVNGNQVTVTGTAQASTTIKVYDGATLVGTGATTSSGAWSVTTSALAVGANALAATATDAAGNVSALSAALNAVVPTPPPPTGRVGFYSDWESSTAAVFKGYTDAGAKVNLYDGGVLIGTATANASGVWSATTKALSSTAIHGIVAQEVNASGSAMATSSGKALIGTGASDVFTSTTGNDVFWGNGSTDTFVFQAGFGHDTISDGGVGDNFQFAKSEFADFASLMSHAKQSGAYTVISSGNDILTMVNTPLAGLQASQFHFV